MRKALVLFAAAAASMAMAVAEEKLGAGVTLAEATSIADVVKNPEAYAGKTIRIDGTATAVCEMMGCWLAVSETDKADSPTIRLKVDHGTIKFPTSAKGKQVSAQGTFEKIAAGDHDVKEAAGAHAKQEAGATHEMKHPGLDGYQLKATGAVIR